MIKTKIEWAQAVWNPTFGCSKISADCANCHAEQQALRITAVRGYEHKGWTAANAVHNVLTVPDKLDDPIKQQKPTQHFVKSVSDLFTKRYRLTSFGLCGRGRSTVPALHRVTLVNPTYRGLKD